MKSNDTSNEEKVTSNKWAVKRILLRCYKLNILQYKINETYAIIQKKTTSTFTEPYTV